MNNKVRAALRILAFCAVAAIPAAAFGIIGNYFYNVALRRSDKDFLNRVEDLMDGVPPEKALRSEQYRREVDRWVKDNPPVNLYLTADDGVQLHALKFGGIARGHEWALVVHGYASSAVTMLPAAREFYSRGLNVLLPDCRGHGQSDGKYIGMGWHDRLDMARWVEEIVKLDPEARIVLYGLSMGAATVMMTAGEPLPDNVVCVIEDSGYSSIKDEFAHQLTGGVYRLPQFPILNAVDIVCRIKAGYSVRDGSALEQIGKCKIPVLFIHGEADDFVPFSMAGELYNAAQCEKELFTVPGAGHGMSWIVDPEGYWRTIDAFLDRHLKRA